MGGRTDRQPGAHVLLAVLEHLITTMVAPTALADVARDRFLVDVLPALDPIGAASIAQAFTWPLAYLVRIVRE